MYGEGWHIIPCLGRMYPEVDRIYPVQIFVWAKHNIWYEVQIIVPTYGIYTNN